jgi:uncharacterized protein (UPF0179 family)
MINFTWSKVPMASDKPLEITLLGVKLSKPGNKFVFIGETENCSDCRLRGACLKLEENRVYEVSSVKDTVHTCKVFEEGVRTVEIFESSYQVTTGAKLAVEGATISFSLRDCDLIDCPYFSNHCCPSYLNEGEKFKVIDVSSEKIECKQGYQLKLVTADRIDNNNNS